MHVVPFFSLRQQTASRRKDPRPVHLQPAHAFLAVTPGSLPETERAAACEVSLPMYPELSDSDVDPVIGAVREAARRLGP